MVCAQCHTDKMMRWRRKDKEAKYVVHTLDGIYSGFLCVRHARMYRNAKGMKIQKLKNI